MTNVATRSRVTPIPFRLKALHVDPAIGLVTGPAGSVRLEPRLLAVLEALAHRAGELVTRAELLDEIWPGGDVYDEALTQCVYQLRQHLVKAGGADHGDLISTVPKRGYLLSGEVQPVVAEPDGASESAAPGRRRPLLLVALAALLLIGAWALVDRRSVQDDASATPRAKSVAVLPFLPLAEEHREPALEMGMADTLIGRLSGIRQLVVRPIALVRRYNRPDRDPLQVGQDLGVDAVVEGSLQRSGEVLRVNVRLLRVADGAALWAGSFDEEFSNIFAVQDSMCSRIAEALALQLGPEELQGLGRGGTANAAAYEAYLKGRFHFSRLTPAEMQASIDYFGEAVAIDPAYAQAWAGLANVQFRMPLAASMRPLDYYPKAKTAAQKALEIDPSLAEAHAILGWIAFWYEWDWAESEARRARELSPMFLLAAGLEAGFLAASGDPEKALQLAREAVRLDENFWYTRMALAEIYFMLARYEEAVVEIQRARQLSADNTYVMGLQVSYLAKVGRQAEAETVLGEIVEKSAEQFVPRYHLALAYNGLDDADTALSLLEQGFEERSPLMTFIGTRETWKPLWGRPEFRDLLQRMNLSVSAD